VLLNLARKHGFDSIKGQEPAGGSSTVGMDSGLRGTSISIYKESLDLNLVKILIQRD
jgi:hypothetical protein